MVRLREHEAKLAAAGRKLARGAGGERVVAASAAADDRRIIHYVLDGRAGNMPIPPDGALHVDEMRENIAPLPYTDSKIPADKDLLIILNVRSFKTRTSREPPISIHSKLGTNTS